MAQTSKSSPFESIPRWAWALIVVAVTASICVAIYLIVFWPHGMAAGSEQLPLREQFDMVNEKRRTAVQIVGGLSLIATAMFTAWNAHSARTNANAATKNALLAESKLSSDRFIKATENLDSDKMSTRVGAVYSLESIARESQRDYRIVFEVLSTFIVDETAKKRLVHEGILEDDAPLHRKLSGPTADVQAAITVIGRRSSTNDTKHAVNLFMAFVPWSLLGNAERGAAKHNFRSVNLMGSCLSNCYCCNCDFSGAVLNSADLSDAVFSRSTFEYTNFESAILSNANFKETDLSKAKNLTQEQIDSAVGDSTTILPRGITPPARWENPVEA